MTRYCRTGTTLTEVLVACTVLSVGVLALAATGASATRSVGRAQRATAAATIAAGRLEQLRATACARPIGGHEQITRGAVTVMRLDWALRPAGRDAWSVLVVIRYLAAPAAWRVDSIETQLACPV